jgi:GNAT superfamily N-acetyltransferase
MALRARTGYWIGCNGRRCCVAPPEARQNRDVKAHTSFGEFGRMRPVIEKEHANAVAGEIGRRLRGFNEDQAGPLNHERLVLSVRDDDGGLLAGLSADFHWNSMYLDVLWVEEKHRRKGLGSSLLRQAERIARERSCELIYLSTFQFQAPEFYAKHGYSLVGELRGVPRNSSRQWFSKDLS